MARTGRRRPLNTPPGKEGVCWAWKKGHPAAGEAHRWHRRPVPVVGRCDRHGGTSRRGPDHQPYTHGAFSQDDTGLLEVGGQFWDEVSLRRCISWLSDALVCAESRRMAAAGVIYMPVAA